MKIKSKQISELDKFTTDNVTEGTTNKYFSNTLARGAFSAGTGITITTGTIASTITQYTDSLAKSASVVDSMAGTQTDQAPSVSSVKSYYTAGTGITITNGVIASTSSGGSGSAASIVSSTPTSTDFSSTDTVIWTINSDVTLPNPNICSIGNILYVKNITTTNKVLTLSGYLLETTAATFNLDGQYSSLTLVNYNNSKWMII